MCATMLLVGAASVRLAGNIQRIVVETLQLRAENEDVLQRLTIKSEQAEAASREKSRFMAAASHDLRQPMQALTLTVDALAGHLRDRVGAQMLRRMHQSMEALNELFDSLLDLSRLDAGQYPVLPGPVLLGPLLDALRDQYAAEAQARGLRLAVLPTRACTRSDEVHLRRILSNLVGNAIKFTRHGSVCVAVRRAGSSAWRIEVRDSGPGIPADRQEAVFQEYVQLEDPETPRRQGLGLGLAIVRRLAAAMGHPVSLRSRPGQGAVFALTVPRLAEDAAQDAPALEPVAGPDLAGVRVLIVEDDAAVRESLVAVLDRWECRTQLAASLDDALAVAARSEQPPDAVICDYRLGGSVTGLDVVEALRRHWNRPLAVAIISGEDDEATLAAIRQAGLMRVRKPVRPAVLRALLGALMRRTADTA
jgi:CheY-like chemotaxis protein